MDDCCDKHLQTRLYNLVFEHCVQHPVPEEKFWHYYLDPDNKQAHISHARWQNLYSLSYPETLSEKANRILMNLSSVYPDYAAEIYCRAIHSRAFYTEKAENGNSFPGIAQIMTDMGYLKKTALQTVSITAKGWQRIDEISRKHSIFKQCFVAIAYRQETVPIRKALCEGIERSKLKPIVMDEKEHNNQIVPEMMYEIDRSSCLVMDVTYSNNGAYYEAGYAFGKGKEVIVTCRKDKFEDNLEGPHFDIRQKAVIVWKDEQDLIDRLHRRIEATVLQNTRY